MVFYQFGKGSKIKQKPKDTTFSDSSDSMTHKFSSSGNVQCSVHAEKSEICMSLVFEMIWIREQDSEVTNISSHSYACVVWMDG